MKKTPLAKVNRKRRAREFARSYGSSDRVEFVKALPCSVLGCGIRPSENAHLTNDGLGRKADADQIFPLCRQHHDEFDKGKDGKSAFCDKYKLDAAYQATLAEMAWSMANKDAT